MKVCNVSMFYCPIRGGQEVYIENLMRVFREHDIESSVLQPKTDCRKENVFFAPRLPSSVLRVLGKVFRSADWFAFNLGLRFSKKILAKQDILISHYAFHYPSIAWHKKVIILSHGVLWKIPPRSLFDRYHKRTSLKAKRDEAFIVANDTHYLRELGLSIQPGEGFFTEVAKNMWVIPNCTDTDYFVRKPEIAKEKIILVPRNIREDRGIHLAIEAFAIFAKEHPDFTLEVVGKGMEPTVRTAYAAYCKSLITKHGLERKVRFAGHVPWSEMLPYYNKAILTLIPSIEKEGTSLSALEAMSCGTATVVTSVGGLPDLPAVQAEPRPDDIATKLAHTLANVEDVAARQQREVQTYFNLQLWSEAWINVIKTVQQR